MGWSKHELAALLAAIAVLPFGILAGRVALDSCLHERHAVHLAAKLDSLDHPAGTASVESTWLVSDHYGSGRSNCDYTVVAVRSGVVSPRDLERYRLAGVHVYVAFDSGVQSLTGGPPLPMSVPAGHAANRYLVVMFEDSLDAGWDLRC